MQIIRPKNIVRGTLNNNCLYPTYIFGTLIEESPFEYELDMDGRTNLGTDFCSHEYQYLLYNHFETLEFINVDTTNITNMRSLFGGSGLKELNFSCFNTSNVTDMAYMFSTCYQLTKLDLGDNWDMSKVTDVTGMFNDCFYLTTVTGKITGISVDLDLNDRPLTAESAMVFINGLKEGISGKTLTLSETTYNSLSPKQIKVGTDKGWTITSK